MSTITIELDRVACAFTLCAAVFATGLCRTGTTRILALVLIVRHGILLKNFYNLLGKLKSND